MKWTKELDDAVGEIISNNIAPASCQIYLGSNGSYTPHGSAVLIELSVGYFLFTASHVSEVFGSEGHPYIQGHKDYIAIEGDEIRSDVEMSNNIDLTFLKLAPKTVEQIKEGNKFIKIDKIRRHINLLDAAQYCVFGYPADKKKVIDGKQVPFGAAYFVQPSNERVYNYYKYDNHTHYALEFKGKGIKLGSDQKEKIKEAPYGLSGCGLWLLLPEYDGSKYEVDYRLVGIMIEYQKGKYHCLVGNKVDIIITELRQNHNLKCREIRVTY